jgi:DNA-binding beta-propeller fold protein YncE
MLHRILKSCLVLSLLADTQLFAAKSSAKTLSTIAGIGVAGYAVDGSPARQASLNNPYGITVGPEQALYICDMDNQVIRKMTPGGNLQTIAGTGRRGYSGDHGPALRAELNEPYEVRFDRQGNMFFVEMKNHLVRRVDAQSGLISTVAGTGQAGFSGDEGAAVQAKLNQPHSIQFGPDGNLYICDIGNNRIRLVDMTTGRISTFAGNGAKGWTPDGARLSGTPLNGPRAIDFDPSGNLWIALREGNAIYRIDCKTRTIHHIAGNGKKGFTGNGGPAKEATLSGPKGIAVGPDRNIYFADTESHSIRMVDLKEGTVELVAGTGQKGDGPDGDPLVCKMNRPHGIFVDKDGSIYIGDSEAHRVRVIRK